MDLNRLTFLLYWRKNCRLEGRSSSTMLKISPLSPFLNPASAIASAQLSTKVIGIVFEPPRWRRPPNVLSPPRPVILFPWTRQFQALPIPSDVLVLFRYSD